MGAGIVEMHGTELYTAYIFTTLNEGLSGVISNSKPSCDATV